MPEHDYMFEIKVLADRVAALEEVVRRIAPSVALADPSPQRIVESERHEILLDANYDSPSFYGPESLDNGVPVQWLGPLTEASFPINFRNCKAVGVEVYVGAVVDSELINEMKAVCGDASITFESYEWPEGLALLRARFSDDAVSSGGLNAVTISVPRVSQFAQGQDKRFLSLAIHKIVIDNGA